MSNFLMFWHIRGPLTEGLTSLHVVWASRVLFKKIAFPRQDHDDQNKLKICWESEKGGFSMQRMKQFQAYKQ